MKRKPTLLHSLVVATGCLLSILAIGSIVACNSVKGSGNKESKEKIITIPAIKDSGSIHKLRQKLPFRYEMDSKTTIEIISDSTKVHLKDSLCWMEYISNVMVHKKQDDGSEKTFPAIVSETTDTMIVHGRN